MGRHSIVCKRTGAEIAIKLDGGTCVCPSAAECRLSPRPPLDRGPVQDERASMDPIDLHALRAIEKGPAVNRTAPGAGVAVVPIMFAADLAGDHGRGELFEVLVGAGAIVWADTGAPVVAGELATGEWFEVDLTNATARRLSADETADAEADRARHALLLRDAEARARGENLDGSPRRETVEHAPDTGEG